MSPSHSRLGGRFCQKHEGRPWGTGAAAMGHAANRVDFNLTLIQCSDLEHGDSASLDSELMNSLSPVDHTVSQLSLAGDLLIIMTFAASRSARRSFTVRLVTFFAVADALGQLALMPIPQLQAATDHNGAICTVQAAMVWYGAMASWLWSTAHAHAVNRRFSERAPMVWTRGLQSTATEEARTHAVCWLVPALAVGAALFSGELGERPDTPNCSLRDSRWAMYFELALWVALLYSGWAFITVHLRIREALNAGVGLLESTASATLRRRLRLWPRFTAYMLCFLISQSPVAARHLLQTFCVQPSYWARWLDPLLMVFGSSNGLLNAVVFGVLNRDLYSRWGCASCCGGNGGEPLLVPASAPVTPSRTRSASAGGGPPPPLSAPAGRRVSRSAASMPSLGGGDGRGGGAVEAKARAEAPQGHEGAAVGSALCVPFLPASLREVREVREARGRGGTSPSATYPPQPRRPRRWATLVWRGGRARPSTARCRTATTTMAARAVRRLASVACRSMR